MIDTKKYLKLNTERYNDYYIFSTDLTNMIPDTIEYLILGNGFCEEIKKLPKNLKKLTIHKKHKEKLNGVHNFEIDYYQ